MYLVFSWKEDTDYGYGINMNCTTWKLLLYKRESTEKTLTIYRGIGTVRADVDATVSEVSLFV